MRVRYMVAGAAIGTMLGVTISRARRWWQTWGIETDEKTKVLAGDDVVTVPVASETRGITIEAAPEDVWPWLVQMGFARAGWYSYDRLDQRGKSVDGIVADWQTLKVGDIMPTHPGGGFEVVAMEPGRSLVLRSDTALVAAQAAAADAEAKAKAKTKGPETGVADESVPAGLQASGAILGATPQQFSASWAFVLEPMPGGRTRLIERFRVWYGESASGRTSSCRSSGSACSSCSRSRWSGSRPAPSEWLGSGQGARRRPSPSPRRPRASRWRP